MLGVSLASCRTAALAAKVPLWQHISKLAGSEPSLPIPMVNILSVGLHAGRGMDVQDFLVVPLAARSIEQAIAMTLRVRSAAARLCTDRGLPTLLADEGGLSPGYETGTEALHLMVDAIEAASRGCCRSCRSPGSTARHPWTT